jgi:hypothetical protein
MEMSMCHLPYSAVPVIDALLSIMCYRLLGDL